MLLFGERFDSEGKHNAISAGELVIDQKTYSPIITCTQCESDMKVM